MPYLAGSLRWRSPSSSWPAPWWCPTARGRSNLLPVWSRGTSGLAQCSLQKPDITDDHTKTHISPSFLPTVAGYLCTWSRSVSSSRRTRGQPRRAAHGSPLPPWRTAACSVAGYEKCAGGDRGSHPGHGCSGARGCAAPCCGSAGGCHVSWSVSLSAGVGPLADPNLPGALGTPHRAVDRRVILLIHESRATSMFVEAQVVLHLHRQGIRLVPKQFWQIFYN